MKTMHNLQFYKACRTHDQKIRKEGMYIHLDALTSAISAVETAEYLDREFGSKTADHERQELKRLLKV